MISGNLMEEDGEEEEPAPGYGVAGYTEIVKNKNNNYFDYDQSSED